MKQLQRKDFTKTLKHYSNYGISLVGGRELKRLSLLESWDDYDFDVYLPSKKKNLQRELVWTLEQKRQFIWSILKRMHIPKITVITRRRYLADTGSDKNRSLIQVIDGKQRINALKDFVSFQFGIIHNGNEYFIDDLDEELRGEVMSFNFVGDEYYEEKDKPWTDDEKIYLFEFVNFQGTPLDVEHLNNLKK